MNEWKSIYASEESGPTGRKKSSRNSGRSREYPSYKAKYKYDVQYNIIFAYTKEENFKNFFSF